MAYDKSIRTQTRDLLTTPAKEVDKEVYEVTYDWATAAGHGDLPARSAAGFARWMDESWEDWIEDEEATVLSVLEGAVTDWCGGRVMPS